MGREGGVAVELLHKDVTDKIISAAVAVHRELGPGLLESAYESCLAHELTQRDVDVARQVPIPLVYKDIKIDCGYRADMIVEGKVLIELKAVEQFDPIHEAQLLTYLKLSGIRVGLLMNFNELRLLDGLKRRVI
jgi:GxxExxY protein